MERIRVEMRHFSAGRGEKKNDDKHIWKDSKDVLNKRSRQLLSHLHLFFHHQLWMEVIYSLEKKHPSRRHLLRLRVSTPTKLFAGNKSEDRPSYGTRVGHQWRYVAR